MQKLTAFAGTERIAEGTALEVALALKQHVDLHQSARLLAFDFDTGLQVDLDLRGTQVDVSARYSDSSQAADESPPEAPPAKRGRGRPRLGVKAREITLLPRHWDWLSHQQGGASATIRRLVETASKADQGVSAAQAATYRFLTSIAGNLPNFEDTLRALYAPDRYAFDLVLAEWPNDVREFAARLAEPVFAAG